VQSTGYMDGMPEARIAQLHVALLDEADDAVRARLHLELARLNLRQAHLEGAARHFREALAYEPTLAAARSGLAQLDRPEGGTRKRDRLLQWLRG
jgi:hypothetical protein